MSNENAQNGLKTDNGRKGRCGSCRRGRAEGSGPHIELQPLRNAQLLYQRHDVA